MTDIFVPVACKYCGEALTARAGHVDPGRPDAMLFCPVHGPMGRLEDFAKAAASDDALRPALAEFERALMEGGEPFTKESGDQLRLLPDAPLVSIEWT